MFELQDNTADDHIGLTADIVAAYVSNNSIPVPELSSLIATVHGALLGLGKTQAAPEAPTVDKPTAAQIRKSVSPDGIVSFIDGKTYKSMKRHLHTHGFEPASYRERYGLAVDYPIVAASYSAQRSALAKNLGLGLLRRKAAAVEPVAASTDGKPRGRGRPKTVKPMAAE